MSQGRGTPAILPLRAQSDLITELVRERLDTILPAAMDAAGLDMWIILCQEDDPDPLYRTMIPFDNWLPDPLGPRLRPRGGRIRRYNLSAADTKDLYERPYAGQLEEKQWPLLVDLVAEPRPRPHRHQHRRGRLVRRRPDPPPLRPPRRQAARPKFRTASSPPRRQACAGPAR